MKIDTHDHCRDETQCEEATIPSTLELASQQGIDIIFDMPNVTNPVINGARVAERLRLVPVEEKWRYRTYIGITEDPDQQREAVRCWRTISHVVGIKMFAGESVGDLAIIDSGAQRSVYDNLTALGYGGVIAVHCEKQDFIRKDLWNPANPISHARWVRPPEAEIESVMDQIRFVREAQFKGHLHICHVSCPESVELVNAAKEGGMEISCEVTPHHIMWDYHMMEKGNGLLFKMNPPLRSPLAVLQLQQQLIEGKIDCIGTDHAPHTLATRLSPPYLSGVPSMETYRELVENFLPNRLGLTAAQIERLTYSRIVEIFALKI